MRRKDSRGLVHLGLSNQNLAYPVLLILALFLILFSSPSIFCEPVVPPHLQGVWYPSNKKELEGMFLNFLKDSYPISEKLAKKELFGLISPHAGYIYCGWTQVFGYKLLKGKEYKRVIIAGPSHYFRFPGIATLKDGYFETPFGKVYIDEEGVKALCKKFPRLILSKKPFLKEHSIEIELPLLQYFLRKDFKVIPLLFGEQTYSLSKKLGESIFSLFGKEKTLFIASSDLSHYHKEEKAFLMDRRTLDYVKDLDADGLFNCIVSGDCEACGYGPIIALLSFAKKMGTKKGVVLSYSTSSRYTKDKSSVVGYGSVGFFAGDGFKGSDLGFSDDDGAWLIRAARRSIEDHFLGKKPKFKTIPEKLKRKGFGIFVTLERRGFLRGCIGTIYGYKPLYMLCLDMAKEAAFHDPRFRPLKKEETIDLDIEISILSKPKRVKDISEIKVKRDGLIIKRGSFSGLLLPQVAFFYGWDKERFLDETCKKAGFHPRCWMEKGTSIFRFEAQIF